MHSGLTCGDLQADIEAKPNLWGNFMVQSADEVPLYAAIPGYDALRTTLTQKLGDYNEGNAAMDLVLFQQVGSLMRTLRAFIKC